MRHRANGEFRDGEFRDCELGTLIGVYLTPRNTGSITDGFRRSRSRQTLENLSKNRTLASPAPIMLVPRFLMQARQSTASAALCGSASSASSASSALTQIRVDSNPCCPKSVFAGQHAGISKTCRNTKAFQKFPSSPLLSLVSRSSFAPPQMLGVFFSCFRAYLSSPDRHDVVDDLCFVLCCSCVCCCRCFLICGSDDGPWF